MDIANMLTAAVEAHYARHAEFPAEIRMGPFFHCCLKDEVDQFRRLQFDGIKGITTFMGIPVGPDDPDLQQFRLLSANELRRSEQS